MSFLYESAYGRLILFIVSWRLMALIHLSLPLIKRQLMSYPGEWLWERGWTDTLAAKLRGKDQLKKVFQSWWLMSSMAMNLPQNQSNWKVWSLSPNIKNSVMLQFVSSIILKIVWMLWFISSVLFLFLEVLLVRVTLSTVYGVWHFLSVFV